MSLTAGVLRDDALRATGDGIEIDIHLPWYRSLPVSCVDGVEVAVAGRPVPGDRVRFRLAGASWALSELAERAGDWWFVLDPATLVISDQPRLRPGQRVPVSVRLDCRIPYILVGPDRALVQSVRVEKELLAQ